MRVGAPVLHALPRRHSKVVRKDGSVREDFSAPAARRMRRDEATRQGDQS